jgi:hypothetical protein
MERLKSTAAEAVPLLATKGDIVTLTNVLTVTGATVGALAGVGVIKAGEFMGQMIAGEFRMPRGDRAKESNTILKAKFATGGAVIFGAIGLGVGKIISK